eukprot:CAMPEP_0183317352 /NCGR_PEP_ID=MMETSP0160_2-20130417/57692_1 /TAXON_ID=2839 ORGANISM="Odontella Sinensis, Strain Grunow 1884" /NCGR_SAMPLE_ID=MMETSP0160_2 /ASSEMBLY_ACC=CAM_ASM_000250 /LENGTH=231 /DNA_ID=CAMNT_0025483357 /DNA_START=62 /DNA_END=757 /DNA_ORIENTATION=+
MTTMRPFLLLAARRGVTLSVATDPLLAFNAPTPRGVRPLSSGRHHDWSSPPQIHRERSAAMSLLGLPVSGTDRRPAFTARQLRDAYFEAAKRCHPDAVSSDEGGNVGGDAEDAAKVGAARRFVRVTEAYELLRALSLPSGSAFEAEAALVSEDEEEEYRIACRQFLGVDAEIVEESKRCPLFREWLQGRTDAAFHWNSFFLKHGGLAPKLRPNSGLLSGGTERGVTRRRRR